MSNKLEWLIMRCCSIYTVYYNRGIIIDVDRW